jgi:hypothetical protein
MPRVCLSVLTPPGGDELNTLLISVVFQLLTFPVLENWRKRCPQNLNLSCLKFSTFLAMILKHAVHDDYHRRHQWTWRISSLIFLLSAAFSTVSGSGVRPRTGTRQQTLLALDSASQKNRQDQLGAVASENSICSQIGIDLLKEGGNAADALVGTVFCVGVIGMYHSGIGGGGFMLVRGSDGSYEDIDFRETAPAAYYQDMYNDEPLTSVFGGLARYGIRVGIAWDKADLTQWCTE